MMPRCLGGRISRSQTIAMLSTGSAKPKTKRRAPNHRKEGAKTEAVAAAAVRRHRSRITGLRPKLSEAAPQIGSPAHFPCGRTSIVRNQWRTGKDGREGGGGGDVHGAAFTHKEHNREERRGLCGPDVPIALHVQAYQRQHVDLQAARECNEACEEEGEGLADAEALLAQGVFEPQEAVDALRNIRRLHCIVCDHLGKELG